MTSLKHKGRTGKEKAEIVLAGLKGVKVSTIRNQYGINQSQYYLWRDQFVNNLEKCFEGDKPDRQLSQLTREIEDYKEIIAELTLADGYRLDYNYDNDQRLTTVQDNTGYTTTYRYDNNGNLTSIDTAPARSHTFDALDRIVAEAGAHSYRYDYDSNDNRTRIVQDNRTTALSYQNQTNRLTHIGSQAVTTDAAGNILTKPGQTLSWNSRGRLERVTGPDFAPIRFEYNYRGLRTQKHIQGQSHLYHYDTMGRRIQHDTNRQTQTATIWLGWMAIAQIHNTPTPRITYLTADHLGTPVIGTDADQTVVWRWRKDAFAIAQPDTDPDNDGEHVVIENRFPGQYRDATTGLYYNWMRYYDPTIGRYLSSDPIGLRGGLNTYGYVGGNPLYWVDPRGLARRCVRPLGGEGSRWVLYENSNLNFQHDLMQYEDGSGDNIGFGENGIILNEDFKEGGDNQCKTQSYDDDRMRQAAKNITNNPQWTSQTYNFATNNCQDFTDALIDEYRRLEKHEK